MTCRPRQQICSKEYGRVAFVSRSFPGASIPCPFPIHKHAARLGLKSVELVDPQHWPMLRELD
jgi:hypothetical protein